METASCGHSYMWPHSTLTDKGCLSQHCAADICCHTPSLAEPLVFPGAFSSSPFIPARCSCSGGSVWAQTGAAHNRLPVVAKHLARSSAWSPTESWYVCRKTQVRELEISIACLPRVPSQLQLGPGKTTGGKWNNGLLSLKSTRGRSKKIIMKDSYNCTEN